MRLPKMTRKLLFSGRSRQRTKLFLGVLFLCLAGPSISRADSVPDWLSAAGRVDLSHFGEGSAAVIVGKWTEFNVDATGKFVLTERMAMRVLNRRSAEPYLDAVGA